MTNVGGVNEYAKDEVNCLLLPPKQPEKIARAVLRLLKDNKLKAKIIDGGINAVSEFSHKLEAKNTYDYFKRLCAS